MSDDISIFYSSGFLALLLILFGMIALLILFEVACHFSSQISSRRDQKRYQQEKELALAAALPEPHSNHALIPASAGDYAKVVRTHSPRRVVGTVWPRATGFAAILGNNTPAGYSLDNTEHSHQVRTLGTFQSLEAAAGTLSEHDHWRTIKARETLAAEAKNREQIKALVDNQ